MALWPSILSTDTTTNTQQNEQQTTLNDINSWTTNASLDNNQHLLSINKQESSTVADAYTELLDM